MIRNSAADHEQHEQQPCPKLRPANALRGRNAIVELADAELRSSTVSVPVSPDVQSR